VAGADLAGVHDRMPAILEPDALDVWLAPTRLDRQHLEGLLGPAPAGTLAHHPVHPRVGDAGNDGPDLVAPFEWQEDVPPPGPEPLRLFDAY
jgi:putative SOS response-associated peptidase YedK